MPHGPLLGVLTLWMGGLASASCYLPFRFLRRWSWEVYWLVQGIFSYLLAPVLVAFLLLPGTGAVLRQTPLHTLLLTYIWGLLWGVGALTFGLSIRYLGIALGYTVVIGFTTIFGTLAPPLFSGEMPALLHHTPGQVVLLGLGACTIGILLSGMAGHFKEQELGAALKQKTTGEFHFARGVLVAIFSGVMSACFAYGLASGRPIAELARHMLRSQGRAGEWQDLPVLVVVLLGGLTSNLVWCAVLLIRNGTARQLLRADAEPTAAAGSSSGQAPVQALNYLLCTGVGILWYLQFFFYGIGQTEMGKYDFSSWTILMACTLIFSTVWGILLKEWKGTSRRTLRFVGFGLAVLVLSTVLVGLGNYLAVSVAGAAR